MVKKAQEVEFTIFDTETTGLEPGTGDRIIEIAAVRVKNGIIADRFESFINPHRGVSEGAFAVNRITPQMLEGAPDFGQVAQKFLDFIEGSCLCSYNAGFDLEFLHHELKLAGKIFPDSILVLDVLKMAKRLMPGLERYALWFVVSALGIKVEQKHRAMSDVELTLAAFSKFLEMLETKGISDLNNFIGLFSINPELLKNITNERIAQIQEAIDLGVTLKIKYLSSTSAQVTEREVIPKEIKEERSHFYLIGYCCLRREERSFRIDGILHLEIL